MEENNEEKKTSKLTALIGQSQEGINGTQIFVHYSENNWETNEEINLILDENSTINQLIEASIEKFKTDLFYDNIDKKKFNVRIFKKKKKIPNIDYPVCSPTSKVKDFGKSHFCLVDIENENEENDKAIAKQGGETIEEEKKIEDKKDTKEKEQKKDTSTPTPMSNNSESNNNNNKSDNGNTNTKGNKPNCRPCTIF